MAEMSPASGSGYVCPYCEGHIKRTIIEDEPGNRHTYKWICKSCFKEFGPEWTSQVWGYSEEGTLLVGLETWVPKQPEQKLNPLNQTIAGLLHRESVSWPASLSGLALSVLAIAVMASLILSPSFEDASKWLL
jgi:hypothetical protein